MERNICVLKPFPIHSQIAQLDGYTDMWKVRVTAGNDWVRHRDSRLGAALAYYSVFSLGPLLLIIVSIAGLFFGREAVATALNDQLRTLLGPAGSPGGGGNAQGCRVSGGWHDLCSLFRS